MKGSAGVLALVLGETVAGGSAELFLTPLWSEVRRGFFKITGVMLLVIGASTWGAAAAGAVPGDGAGRWTTLLSMAFTLATGVWLLLLFVRQHAVARAVGLATVPLTLGLLIVMAFTAEGSMGVAAFQLLAGAAFLGAVMDGLLLGHWYLTDRGLSREPINRATMLLIGAVVLEAVGVIGGGFGPTEAGSQFNPLLTSAGLASWIALGMVGATGLIAVLTRLTLRGQRASAVQSATGFFYLAVITAFTAEVAAKVPFLG